MVLGIWDYRHASLQVLCRASDGLLGAGRSSVRVEGEEPTLLDRRLFRHNVGGGSTQERGRLVGLGHWGLLGLTPFMRRCAWIC
jgi:hypothetical protein